MRAHPAPADSLVVIRIAAGCPKTLRDAVRATGVGPDAVRDACVLYLQQIHFAPGADSYRVLGVRSDAPRSEMREHMRWLMTWLHPDENRGEWESVFAERVLRAWREAGTKKGASSVAAVAGPGSVPPKRRSRRLRFPVHRWVALPLAPESGSRARSPLLGEWLRSICMRLGLR
jgi:hypothetical protein